MILNTLSVMATLLPSSVREVGLGRGNRRPSLAPYPGPGGISDNDGHSNNGIGTSAGGSLPKGPMPTTTGGSV